MRFMYRPTPSISCFPCETQHNITLVLSLGIATLLGEPPMRCFNSEAIGNKARTTLVRLQVLNYRSVVHLYRSWSWWIVKKQPLMVKSCTFEPYKPLEITQWAYWNASVDLGAYCVYFLRRHDGMLPPETKKNSLC